MSLRPQPGAPPVPDDTVRVARAAFPRGTPHLLLRERLGAVFRDGDFADLHPALGQPAYAPWRLALVTLLQFREGLRDRQAGGPGAGRGGRLPRPPPRARPPGLCPVAAGAGHPHAVPRGAERPAGGRGGPWPD